MADKSPDTVVQSRIAEARRTGANSLRLNNLGLTLLPESIGQLTQLRELFLGGNCLTSLPESIGQLTRLQELDLGKNQFRKVPEAIGQLAQLQLLYLNQNKLGDLPTALGQLTQLRALDLDQNQMQEVPAVVGQLTQLRALDIKRNKLESLPEWLGQLTQLRRLYLHGNYALGIPPEILGPEWSEEGGVNKKESTKPANILQYYFKRAEEETRCLNEAKIILVGQDDVGKTSLVRRLISGKYNPKERKTEGVNIVQWHIPGKQKQTEEKIRLHVWDFGGQEIMHATHQFFFTKRSLYLLVLDAGKDENESNIHYWLKTIQSYGEDAPVLVVINKSELPNNRGLNETRLKKDYAPNVRGFFAVSCATGTGIPELREAIEKQIHTLPHVFDEFPASYFKVKEALEAKVRRADFIDIADYEQLCHDQGMSEQRDQDILIRFLHELGNVLNFHDPASPYKLQETKLINPEWVTAGVYALLNSPTLTLAGGQLEREKVGDLLPDPDRYPPARQRFIIEMMQKFELCANVPGSYGQRLLIPELLSKNEPDLNWNSEGALNFEYHYTVLPGGIIPRFIVWVQKKLIPIHACWRSGAVVDIRGCRALVRGDTQAGRVYVSIKGKEAPGRRNALLAIRNAFEAIHATIPKIEVQEKVSLPDQPSVVIDYDYLLTLEDHEEDRFIPPGTQTYYLVEPLLDSIVEPDTRRAEREQLREMLALKKSANAAQGNPFVFTATLMAIAVIVIMLTQIVFE